MGRRKDSSSRCLCCSKTLVFIAFATVLILVYKAYQGAESPYHLAGEDGDKKIGSDSKSVDFELHTEVSYAHRFNDEHQCKEGRTRNPLPSSLQKPFSFTASVQTNLKILFMGDFQTMLLSEAFQEATGIEKDEMEVLKQVGFAREKTLHIGTTDDLGVVAGYRSQGMLSHRGEDVPITGWSHDDVERLLDYEMPWGKPLDAFDVLIYKPPQSHGEGSLSAVTQKSLNQTLELASDLFGVSTVIFMTMPIHQDYETEFDLATLREKNELIRAFARDFEPDEDQFPTVEHVFVLNVDKLTDAAVMENGASIGMTVNDVDDEHLFERLNEGKSHPAVAHVCGEPKKQARKHEICKGNMIAADGRFWCMETVGGRILAGLACSLQCLTDKDHDHNRDYHCSQRCNEQFMSIEEVDESRYTIGP